MDTPAKSLEVGGELLPATDDHALRLRLIMEEATVTQQAVPPSSTSQRRYFLGEALVEGRVLMQWQVDEALQYQLELADQGQSLRLGDILVRHNLVRPSQLKAALAAQLASLLSTIPDPYMQRFGDYLVEQGLVTLAQLYQGLAWQAELREQGTHQLLGDVLVDAGYIQRHQLTDALLQWHQAMNVELW